MPLTDTALPPAFVADPDALLPLGVRVAGLGLGSIDYRADTIILDNRAAALFELPAHCPIPRDDLHAQIHSDDRPKVEAQVAAMLSPGLPDFIDVVHRVKTADGKDRWLSARKQVVFAESPDDTRVPATGLVAIMDVTAHKTTERQVKDLMHEMNHRLKNLLTVVQSIARLTARHGTPEDFLPRFDARLRALSHNQDLLMSRGGMGVTFGALVREQLHPFTGGVDKHVQIAGPDLPIRFSAIQPVGLALHELATNATKYGALSTPNGNLDLIWKVEGDQFTLAWTESGGPQVVPPQRTGFGSTVLQGMTRSALEAEVALDYRPEGLHWSMTCALSNIRDDKAL